MKDPKPAPAGSPGEGPAAATPALVRATEPGAYQFPTRKARRVAELTGMIPIVPPAAAAGSPAPSLKHDAGTRHGEKPADTGAGVESAAESADVVSPDAESPRADAKAAVSGATDFKGDPSDGPGSNGSAADAASEAADTKVAALSGAASALLGGNAREEVESAVRQPVPAATVAGAPLVPVPPGPIAAIPDAATAKKPPRTPKAGRDLPAAIGVGVTMLLIVVGSTLFYPLAFVVVATAFAVVGVWEVTRAIGGKGIKAPLTPVMIGTLAMPASAYFAGAEGLLFALVASAGATLLWRSLDPDPGAVKSILAGIFSLMWIPFLLSFVFLMLRGEHGPTLGFTTDLGNINQGVLEVVIMLILVVANDTFGYLVGVLFGKHPMAPKISPKKSWEGFAGSMGGALLVAIPAAVFVLNEQWWIGVALAIGMVFAGTGGDFAESMVKRELGIKDMSNLLPGHGGVMDRLDSILFAAPVAYAIFSVLGQH